MACLKDPIGVELEWLELMEMWTRTTRIIFLATLAFPVVPVALAACHLPDVVRHLGWVERTRRMWPLKTSKWGE